MTRYCKWLDRGGWCNDPSFEDRFRCPYQDDCIHRRKIEMMHTQCVTCVHNRHCLYGPLIERPRAGCDMYREAD